MSSDKKISDIVKIEKQNQIKAVFLPDQKIGEARLVFLERAKEIIDDKKGLFEESWKELEEKGALKEELAIVRDRIENLAMELDGYLEELEKGLHVSDEISRRNVNKKTRTDFGRVIKAFNKKVKGLENKPGAEADKVGASSNREEAVMPGTSSGNELKETLGEESYKKSKKPMKKTEEAKGEVVSGETAAQVETLESAKKDLELLFGEIGRLDVELRGEHDAQESGNEIIDELAKMIDEACESDDQVKVEEAKVELESIKKELEQEIEKLEDVKKEIKKLFGKVGELDKELHGKNTIAVYGKGADKIADFLARIDQDKDLDQLQKIAGDLGEKKQRLEARIEKRNGKKKAKAVKGNPFEAPAVGSELEPAKKAEAITKPDEILPGQFFAPLSGDGFKRDAAQIVMDRLSGGNGAYADFLENSNRDLLIKELDLKISALDKSKDAQKIKQLREKREDLVKEKLLLDGLNEKFGRLKKLVEAKERLDLEEMRPDSSETDLKMFQSRVGDGKSLAALKKDLEKTAEEFSDLVFRRKIQEVPFKFVVHGNISGKSGKLECFPDFDGEVALGLLKSIGIDMADEGDYRKPLKNQGKATLKFVPPGGRAREKELAVHIDTGQMDGLAILPDGTVFIDHHGEKSKNDTSAAGNVLEVLESWGMKDKLLKKTGLSEDQLSNMVDFVTRMDNKSYFTTGDREKDKEAEASAYNGSDRTMVGLHRFVKFDKLVEFFKSGKSPAAELTEKELEAYGLTKKPMNDYAVAQESLAKGLIIVTDDDRDKFRKGKKKINESKIDQDIAYAKFIGMTEKGQRYKIISGLSAAKSDFSFDAAENVWKQKADRSQEQKESIKKSNEKIKDLIDGGFVCESGTYGKILVNILADKETSLSPDAARANGFDVLLIWSKASESFVVTTRDSLMDNDGFKQLQGKRIRETMWIKPRAMAGADAEPLGTRLADVLAALGVGLADLNPVGESKGLAAYIRDEIGGKAVTDGGKGDVEPIAAETAEDDKTAAAETEDEKAGRLEKEGVIKEADEYVEKIFKYRNGLESKETEEIFGQIKAAHEEMKKDGVSLLTLRLILKHLKEQNSLLQDKKSENFFNRLEENYKGRLDYNNRKNQGNDDILDVAIRSLREEKSKTGLFYKELSEFGSAEKVKEFEERYEEIKGAYIAELESLKAKKQELEKMTTAEIYAIMQETVSENYLKELKIRPAEVDGITMFAVEDGAKANSKGENLDALIAKYSRFGVDKEKVLANIEQVFNEAVDCEAEREFSKLKYHKGYITASVGVGVLAAGATAGMRMSGGGLVMKLSGFMGGTVMGTMSGYSRGKIREWLNPKLKEMQKLDAKKFDEIRKKESEKLAASGVLQVFATQAIRKEILARMARSENPKIKEEKEFVDSDQELEAQISKNVQELTGMDEKEAEKMAHNLLVLKKTMFNNTKFLGKELEGKESELKKGKNKDLSISQKGAYMGAAIGLATDLAMQTNVPYLKEAVTAAVGGMFYGKAIDAHLHKKLIKKEISKDLDKVRSMEKGYNPKMKDKPEDMEYLRKLLENGILEKYPAERERARVMYMNMLTKPLFSKDDVIVKTEGGTQEPAEISKRFKSKWLTGVAYTGGIAASVLMGGIGTVIVSELKGESLIPGHRVKTGEQLIQNQQVSRQNFPQGLSSEDLAKANHKIIENNLNKEASSVSHRQYSQTEENFQTGEKTAGRQDLADANSPEHIFGDAASPVIEISAKISTMSHAVHEALKGTPKEVQDKFIHEYSTSKNINITPENRVELLNRAERQYSISNIDKNPDNNIKDLIHKGDKVFIDRDGRVVLVEASGQKAGFLPKTRGERPTTKQAYTPEEREQLKKLQIDLSKAARTSQPEGIRLPEAGNGRKIEFDQSAPKSTQDNHFEDIREKTATIVQEEPVIDRTVPSPKDPNSLLDNLEKQAAGDDALENPSSAIHEDSAQMVQEKMARAGTVPLPKVWSSGAESHDPPIKGVIHEIADKLGRDAKGSAENNYGLNRELLGKMHIPAEGSLPADAPEKLEFLLRHSDKELIADNYDRIFRTNPPNIRLDDFEQYYEQIKTFQGQPHEIEGIVEFLKAGKDQNRVYSSFQKLFDPRDLEGVVPVRDFHSKDIGDGKTLQLIEFPGRRRFYIENDRGAIKVHASRNTNTLTGFGEMLNMDRKNFSTLKKFLDMRE